MVPAPAGGTISSRPGGGHFAEGLVHAERGLDHYAIRRRVADYDFLRRRLSGVRPPHGQRLVGTGLQSSPCERSLSPPGAHHGGYPGLVVYGGGDRWVSHARRRRQSPGPHSGRSGRFTPRRVALLYLSTSLLWWQAVAGILGAKSSHALRSNSQCTWRPREGVQNGYSTAIRRML